MVDKEVISKFDFFSGVSEDNLREIADQCTIREYKEDEVIFNSGDPADTLYGVAEGSVELSIVFRDRILKADIQYEEAKQAHYEEVETPITVDRIEAGEVFGWSSLAAPEARTATARCLEPVRVFALSAADLKARFQKDPALGYAIMEKLSNIIARRLQKRTEKLVDAWGEAFGEGRTAQL